MSRASAYALVKALGGRWQGPIGPGGLGMARCPAHDDRSPSLSLGEGQGGRLLLHCFAGCSFEAVRDALAARGLLEDRAGERSVQHARLQTEGARAAVTDLSRRQGAARRIWDESHPIAGSLVERYLRARSISTAVNGRLPACLRFQPALAYYPYGGCSGFSDGGPRHPAMVAPITSSDGGLSGVHLTFLRADGLGKAALTPARKVAGVKRGCSIQLVPGTAGLVIGEGIETSLSAWELLQPQLGQGWGCAAAIDAGNLARLDRVEAHRVVVVCDRDGNGVGLRAGRRLAERLAASGTEVSLATPPPGYGDFNDLACALLRIGAGRQAA